jgi:NADH-quinone oxidoreductase subunit M
VAFDQQILLWLLGLPLLGACIVALLGPQRGSAVRAVSLVASLATLTLALILAGRFMALDRTHMLGDSTSKTDAAPTFKPVFVPGSTPKDEHMTSWELVNFGQGAVHFYLGVDGLNIWMVVLTAVLMLPSVLVSWTHVTDRVNEFFAWLLALQTAMMGIFLAFDIMLFYAFFEVSLVPLFFLIGIWGGSNCRLAARKFFLYTLTGSMLTLLGVLAVVQFFAVREKLPELTFSIPRLVQLVHQQLRDDPTLWSRERQQVVFLLLMAGFAVKVPLVPLHTWLPLAHVEAPTAGSVDLAGVLLKVGVYGFLRLCIPLAPDVSLSLGLPVISILAAIGVVYGGFCAYGQTDIKRLIAYSSVSHLGLCMLGMFSLTAAGLTGSVLQMINHGLTSAALFLLVGMIYERYHTRQLADYGGMAAKLPIFAVFMVFMCMASAGLPGLNGFVGEVLCLIGIVQNSDLRGGFNWFMTVAGASGMILGAWYLITMMRKLLFGQLKEPEHHGHEIQDLKPREWLILAPIALLCVLLGVYPQPIIKSTQPDVDVVLKIADRARSRRETVRSGQTNPPASPAAQGLTEAAGRAENR